MSWACWWKRHCVCVDSGGVVMWFESQSRIAHMCWSPQRGRRWTKHPFIAAVTAVRREKLFTRGFMLFTTLSSLTLSGPSAPSSSCPAFTRLIPDHLSLSLSLCLGTSIEHYDRLSLIWCSPLRWPNTLNTSTNLSTASTSRWLLWRRTGWDWKERNHPASLLSLLHTCVENSRSNFSAFFFFSSK